MVGAQWLWIREHLPTLEDLLQYAELQDGFVPQPPILGLLRRSESCLTPEGEAIMLKLRDIKFEAERRAIAEFFEARFPLGRPTKTSWPEFCEMIKLSNRQVKFGDDERLIRYTNAVWLKIRLT